MIGKGKPRAFQKGRDIGKPRFANGEQIGDFTVLFYQGHSYINKRNSRVMDKSQHWYKCRCKCGKEESRSQQELVDTRRQQKCAACRSKVVTTITEPTPTHPEETV